MVTSTREHDDRPPRPTPPHAEGPHCDVPPSPWAPLVENFRELLDYLAYYLSVQADQFRLGVRRVILAAMLGIMALVAGLAFIVTAVAILLSGIAQGLGHLFGGQMWLGNLFTGLGVLCLTALALVVVSRRIVSFSRTRTFEKYAELRQQQRQQHGHDVGSRSRSSGN